MYEVCEYAPIRIETFTFVIFDPGTRESSNVALHEPVVRTGILPPDLFGSSQRAHQRVTDCG
jgi:hypothetical protein